MRLIHFYSIAKKIYMPEHSSNHLAQLHPSPRDERIEFIEEGHVYIIDQIDRSYTSVTTVIHHFFHAFDADKVIAKMMASRNWSSSKYNGMSVTEIKEQWAEIARLASDEGSALHQQIELFYNDALDSPLPSTPEFKYFLLFQEEHIQEKLLRPYRTEWYVFDEASKICGSIDMVFCEQDDPSIVHIYDWKRSKEIKKENRWESGMPPLDHFPDCNFSHYTLQLNLYKYILETCYEKTVRSMMLVILHPNQPSFLLEPVPVLSGDIKAIISAHQNSSL